ncbi:MAG: hypothetical protein Q9225_004038 [Loekoesia sp. 1 TL-2023]
MIQAKSFSGVVDLADDPPLSPYTSLGHLDPLVLYIARVPGSRDVFLTTTKPLQKVVTAQDVQSSLYYIHVDSEDDERLRKSTDSRQIVESEAVDQVNGLHPVNAGAMSKREPLASDPNDAVGTQPTIASIVHPDYQMPLSEPHNIMQITRKPVGHDVQSNLKALHTNSKPSNARIMGPRAMHARLHSNDSPGLGLSHDKENLLPRRWSEQSPVLQPLLSPKLEAQRNAPNFTDNTKNNDSKKGNASRSSPLIQEAVLSRRSNHQRQSTDGENDGLSLTLIRRYDGSQWNVGKISSICDPSCLWKNQSTGRHDDLTVQISTLGYARFRAHGASEASATSDQVFERHLSKLRRRSQGSDLPENSSNTMNHRKSQMSIDSPRLSTPSLQTTSEKTIAPKSLPQNKPASIKGYGFYSPWNGTCEFSSGISGHALKCKHTAPPEGSQAITVSELRFNLPSSSNMSAISPRDLNSPSRPKNIKRLSYFSRSRGSDTLHREDSVSDPNNGDGKNNYFDLSLGQEHAGGGFGGKQAKLGKLIIEPEGLKMLDLLVAANMGLWWRVYERSA